MGVFGEEEGIALQRCGVVIITLDKLNQQKPKLRILRKLNPARGESKIWGSFA